MRRICFSWIILAWLWRAYTRTTLFSQMLFFPWPGPEDRSQRDPAHSAGYFSEDTKSLLPIAHLPQEIQVTQQKRSSMSNIWTSFASVKARKHIKKLSNVFLWSLLLFRFSFLVLFGLGWVMLQWQKLPPKFQWLYTIMKVYGLLMPHRKCRSAVIVITLFMQGCTLTESSSR